MNFRRFLHPDSIRLDLHTRGVPPGGFEDGDEPDSPRNIKRVRRELFGELRRAHADLGENEALKRFSLDSLVKFTNELADFGASFGDEAGTLWSASMGLECSDVAPDDASVYSANPPAACRCAQGSRALRLDALLVLLVTLLAVRRRPAP